MSICVVKSFIIEKINLYVLLIQFPEEKEKHENLPFCKHKNRQNILSHSQKCLFRKRAKNEPQI